MIRRTRNQRACMSKYVCERKSIIQRKYCSAKKIFIENIFNWSSLISHMRLFNFCKYYCVSEYVRCARVFEVFICASFWFRVRKKVAIKQNKKKMSHSHQTHMNVPTFDVFITNSTDGVCATAKNAIVWFFRFSLKHLFIIFSLSLSIMFCFWFEFVSLLFGLHFTIAVYPNCRIERTNEHLWEMPVLLTHTTWNTNALCCDCLFIVMEHTKRQTVRNLLVLPSLVFVFCCCCFSFNSQIVLSLCTKIYSYAVFGCHRDELRVIIQHLLLSFRAFIIYAFVF